MLNFSAIVGGLWLFFLGYWLISAVGAKKTVNRAWRGFAIRALFAAAVVSFFRSGFAQRFTFLSHQRPANTAAGVVAIAICLTGIGLAVWARRNLGRNWGMPMSVKANPELITSGPYAYIRHPIYTGIFITMLGSSLVIGFWLVLAVVFGAYFVYSAKTEEKRLLQLMPDQFPAYMRSTKMLVPFVY
jgi:protein-S-isoprenylcysteine O-methyltransferase Ste14